MTIVCYPRGKFFFMMKSYYSSVLAWLPVFVALLLFAGYSHNELIPSPVPVKNPDPLQILLEGNRRFSAWHPIHPDESRDRVIEISKAQHPFAVVVSCSDSRVPPELVFDQGLGDLFVIRTAGNVIGDFEIGSVEYAVEHLGVRLILVMGHRECGAIKAFVEGGKNEGHIEEIVENIREEEEIRKIPLEAKDRLELCIGANILHGVHQLEQQSSIIREKLEKKDLQIRAAQYDIENGVVTILD